MNKKTILSVAFLGVSLLLTWTGLANAQRNPTGTTTARVPQKQGAEAVFAKAASKIVFLITRRSGELHARGSGIILSADGYIGTNYHVLQGADAVEVRFFPNPENSEDYQSFNSAKLYYADPKLDIAILKVNSDSLPFLRCQTAECASRVGEQVYAIGNPKGLSNTISEGIVSALRIVDGEDTIQHTAAISPGSSGGALVDANGQLLGMNSWQVAEGQNLNFAISGRYLLEALAAARSATTALAFPPDPPSQVTDATQDKSQPDQPGLAALRTIANTIKSCPRIIKFETKNEPKKNEGPLTRSRLYYGPPVNVIWDVTRSSSVRAPYQAYVEFSVPREYWVPPDIWNKWADKASDLYAKILQPMSALKYRYEFDLGSDGIRLTKTLMRAAEETEWKDAPFGDQSCSQSGCAPACWLAAAQAGQVVSSETKQ
jgi:S1-C subfamily serine protease